MVNRSEPAVSITQYSGNDWPTSGDMLVLGDASSLWVIVGGAVGSTVEEVGSGRV
jgi:hypothetical protein